jgi:hypothetical protein
MAAYAVPGRCRGTASAVRHVIHTPSAWTEETAQLVPVWGG